MKCVVTGGAGFIGSHIVDELVRRGEEVAVVDNLVTGNMDNLKQAQASDRIRFVKGDIKDLRLLKKEFKKTDFVFHHAALISVVESMDKPEEYELNNVQGTRNVLEAARLNGVKRVMFSSSGAVYVKNIVEAHMLACKSESGFGEPINIGSGKETSVNELYMTISKILGNKAKPNYEPARGGEARKALFDISKAERVLGYKCKYDLMTGIRDTVEWFRQKKEEKSL